MHVYMYILHFILQSCVKLYKRVHAWSDATRVFFAFAHACDTRGLFKLWVICTYTVTFEDANALAEPVAYQ